MVITLRCMCHSDNSSLHVAMDPRFATLKTAAPRTAQPLAAGAGFLCDTSGRWVFSGTLELLHKAIHSCTPAPVPRFPCPILITNSLTTVPYKYSLFLTFC